MSEITFENLRAANEARCEPSFHAIDAWNPLEWAGAMAGEAGEACNKAKKLRRGEAIDPLEIGKEIADTVIYADLLAQRLGLRLEDLVANKFNEVSIRVGSDVFMPDPD